MLQAVRVLDVHEVSICFNDTQHANDRRRRSQMGLSVLLQTFFGTPHNDAKIKS